MKTDRETLAKLPPPGEPLTVQIAPFGEFPGTVRGTDGQSAPVVQILDAAAFARILDAWRQNGSKELLVDADHDSIGGSTRAYAWASNLRVDPDRGLLADFILTDHGRQALQNREYRFVSPVFNIEENTNAILALDSIALTNRPNLPVSCVLNRESSGTVNVEDNKGKSMEKIISALGLPPEATEEEVLAALDALKKAAEDANAKLLQNEAQACADKNKDKIANRDEFVRLYVKNGRDTALAFLAAVKTPEKPAPSRISANSAMTPADKPDVKTRLAGCRTPQELAAFAVANARELAQIVK